MDGSFFAFGFLGLFLGYIVGDFQRERRYRREARSNLALSVSRSNQRASQRAAAVRDSSANSHSDGDGAAFALANARLGEARRRTIRGDNGWTRPNPAPAGRYSRGSDETPVMAGGFDFDGD